MNEGRIRFAAGAVAAVAAETVTLPIDTIKVRLQLQYAGAQNLGIVGVVGSIVKKEGVKSLWKGLTPALVRQSLYTSMMMALYAPSRNIISEWIDAEDVRQDGGSSYWTKLLAGGLVGGVCITFLNPIEIVKVRMQADAVGGLYKTGILRAFSEIVKSEGALALWKGLVPNIQRAIIVNASELGTYDQAKSYFTTRFESCQQHPILAQFNASIVAGFAGAAASNPIDVTKTRLMNQRSTQSVVSSQQSYKGMTDCFIKIIRYEGFTSLYKGFIPNWMRKGPWCVVFFPIYEILVH